MRLPAVLLLVAAGLPAQSTPRLLRIDSLSGLQLGHARADVVEWKGRRAVHLLPDYAASPNWQAQTEAMAIVLDSDFSDGTIDIELAGAPKVGAVEGSRGFVGVAFRVAPNAAQFECFYLRPTNGRADDQLRRNHATQYVSYPAFGWERLRAETPGVYESYVDIEPGVWTTLKIVVKGTKAQLYVNGATQPALIVNDLKLGQTRGGIAMWIGQDTEAYFSKIAVTPAP